MVTQDGARSDTPSSTGDEFVQSGSHGKKQKTVAIDVTQNEQFTHRLLPSQSPEFDNVINQVININEDVPLIRVILDCVINEDVPLIRVILEYVINEDVPLIRVILEYVINEDVPLIRVILDCVLNFLLSLVTTNNMYILLGAHSLAKYML